VKRKGEKVLLGAAQEVGGFESYGAGERARESGEAVPFAGDLPAVAGKVLSQNRLRYTRPRPDTETVEDLIYTPAGHAWQRGKLVERFSAVSPSLKQVLAGPPRPARTLDEAWIIESESPYTYGDWVGDHIRALVMAAPGIGPVLLPRDLGHKSYVKRDLAALDLTLDVADAPVRIKRAHVLRKVLPSYYWGPPEVAAYRARFDVKLVPPRKGSLIYLSREGVQSEAIHRPYPSRQVAGIIRSLGGEVFDTRQASPEAFARIAENVETIVADQGSAIFGVLQWQTRTLIEITTDHWWHSANLFFSKGAGVENYAVLVCDRYDDAALDQRLRSLLADLAGQA